jgi:carnitine 3-dehydrogenase
MGTFLTYRLAGGEKGMRHFMSQFGPALKWPWTKLEAPELTEELLEKIVAQSDAQAKQQKAFLPEGASGSELRQFEQLRDDCLISALHGLKKNGFAAGASQKQFEDALYEREASARRRRIESTNVTKDTNGKDHTNGKAAPETALFREFRDTVRADWIDYNGHMTESRYLHVFGEGTDALLSEIGMTPEAIKESGKSYYTVETHIMNKKEVKVGEALTVSTQILKVDDKRIHLFHWIEKGAGSAGSCPNADTVLATAEQMLLHVDSTAGRACANGNKQVTEKLNAIASNHANLEKPKEAGRFCGAPRN